jgi:hypothetical protein
MATTESLSIPALPSTYAGIKFRSRLEARWAYYFDLIGLPWKYEPEGYALSAGNYLPDFKCFGFFVEVKPTQADLEQVAPKLAELSHVTGCAVFCVVDDPSVKPQPYWEHGSRVGEGSFSHYAFQSKGWTFPNLCDGPMDVVDQNYAGRACRLQFNRGGIAEVDWEVLRARNEVIRRRREIILEHKELPTEEWFTQVLEPLNRRLVSLDKLAFPMETPWRAA